MASPRASPRASVWRVTPIQEEPEMSHESGTRRSLTFGSTLNSTSFDNMDGVTPLIDFDESFTVQIECDESTAVEKETLPDFIFEEAAAPKECPCIWKSVCPRCSNQTVQPVIQIPVSKLFRSYCILQILFFFVIFKCDWRQSSRSSL
ncbi:uncharacterized protein LOC113215286 [Frankliniella occidentalis]|uniref:Uncharacterized protein LOC113215286 n=1 Tax=Frankliniella occidentalis TaxID=133901 RepID=A0A9C6X6Z5_FRAOC|nr:uncharacterized protein LOC113215286 [Frankliniella occidentalis]